VNGKNFVTFWQTFSNVTVKDIQDRKLPRRWREKVLIKVGTFLLDNATFFLTSMEPCIARCVFYITNEMHLIQCSLLLSELYMFRAVFPPIIRRL
jgi:hypothetical protein